MSYLTNIIAKHISIEAPKLTEIANCFETKQLPRKTSWVRAGELTLELAVIEKGYMRMYGLENGKEITVWIGGPGKFITSISSFVDHRPGIWNIESLSDCQLHIIKRDTHFRLCQQFREWLEFENLLLSKAITALEYRNYELLKLKAEERYQALFSKNPSIFLEVPAKYIASLLGISEETLSRLRKNHRDLS